MAAHTGAIATVILAGGKNSRMQGQKKVFLRYNDRSFLEYAAAALEKIGNIHLSVEEREPYLHTGYPLIEDMYHGTGPMGAIASALSQLEEEAVLVLACDMPLLSREHIRLLNDDFRLYALPVFLADERGRANPLAGIYLKRDLHLFEKWLLNGNYKLSLILEEMEYRTIRCAGTAEALTNINTPEQLCKLLHRE